MYSQEVAPAFSVQLRVADVVAAAVTTKAEGGLGHAANGSQIIVASHPEYVTLPSEENTKVKAPDV